MGYKHIVAQGAYTMHINDYPLWPGMSFDEIKAVKHTDIIMGAMKIAKKLQKTKYASSKVYEIDMGLAKKYLTFISLLKHADGKVAGLTFRLLEFQAEFITEVFCVVNKKTRLRKHKEATLFIPRKGGKSALTSAILLAFMFIDKEKGKEIYSIASDISQASIIYTASVSMMRQSPFLEKRIKQYKAEKRLERADGAFLDIFKVLSATADTKDGLKSALTLADEPHSYKSSALYDVVTEGSVAKDEPLALMLSTAGYNKQGFFFKKLKYAKDVMSGIIKNDDVYLMEFSLDDSDDWTDEELWKKVNPALGFGTKLDALRSRFKTALHSGTDEVSFKTKHLNLWTDSAITWIKSPDWKASNKKGTITEQDLIGRECYGGLDLSSTTDITSTVYVFPNYIEVDAGGKTFDGTYDVLCRFYIPEDTARRRSKEDKVSYLDWIKDGYITPTGGNVIDYEHLFEHIMRDKEMFDIKEMAFDRWNASSIVTKMTEAGIPCVGFGQGFKSMSSPVKAIESLVLQGKLNHGDNPVLAWCVNNVLIVSDPADNVKMDKSKAVERIDGAVALAMAIGRAEAYIEDEVDWQSLIG